MRNNDNLPEFNLINSSSSDDLNLSNQDAYSLQNDSGDDAIIFTNLHPLSVHNHSCVINYSNQFKELLAVTDLIYEIKILLVEGTIEDQDLILLVDYLNSNYGKNIKILYLMSSSLNNQQAKTLIENLVSSKSTITELSLWENNLSGDLDFLSKITHFGDYLKLLNLSTNNLSVSMQYLIDILDKCIVLQDLDLSCCGLDDSSIEKLYFPMLHHNNLTRISFAYNQDITDASFDCIKSLIQHKKQLKYIDLTEINFSDQSINELNKLARQTSIELIINNPLVNNTTLKCVIS